MIVYGDNWDAAVRPIAGPSPSISLFQLINCTAFSSCALAPICHHLCSRDTHNFGKILKTLETLPSSSEALLLNLPLKHVHTMHVSWILSLLETTSILSFLFLLSSANPASFSLTKGTANHELHLNTPTHPIHNFPAISETQPISKRATPNGISYNLWENGWTSRSNTYVRKRPSFTHLPTQRY